jgi:hypothetical protein
MVAGWLLGTETGLVVWPAVSRAVSVKGAFGVAAVALQFAVD